MKLKHKKPLATKENEEEQQERKQRRNEYVAAWYDILCSDISVLCSLIAAISNKRLRRRESSKTMNH